MEYGMKATLARNIYFFVQDLAAYASEAKRVAKIVSQKIKENLIYCRR